VQRRSIGILVFTAIFGLVLWSGPTHAGDVEVTVLEYPKEVEARSIFYVRLRITNHGRVTARPCDTATDESKAVESCVAVVYRKGKRPPQFIFSRVEVSPVLRPTASIEPGRAFDTVVELPTPDRKGEYVIYLYSVTGQAGHFVWKEIPLTVNVGNPPQDVTRRLFVARTLLGIYILGTVAMIWLVYKRRGMAAKH
jgi:hypothetical protein